MQAQVYSIIKDLDPYHATIGASDCSNSWMFRDVATKIPPTVARSSIWMEHGQPALQLSLDLGGILSFACCVALLACGCCLVPVI